MKKDSAGICPQFHYAVELIGRRWTGAIISSLLAGATRFGELRDAIPEITDRMLTERLQELEQHGIVARTVIPDTPVRIEYALTDKGLGLQVPLSAITDWAHVWVTDSDTAIVRGQGKKKASLH